MSSPSDIAPVKVETVADIKVGDLIQFVGYSRDEWYLVITHRDGYAAVRDLTTWQEYGIYQFSIDCTDHTYTFYRPESR